MYPKTEPTCPFLVRLEEPVLELMILGEDLLETKNYFYRFFCC